MLHERRLRLAGGERIGARRRSMKHSGAPNQDALSWWSAEGEKALAVLCVADGHGGSEYTHSHIGARRAVKEAQMLLVSEVLPRDPGRQRPDRFGPVQTTTSVNNCLKTPGEPLAGIDLRARDRQSDLSEEETSRSK